MIKPAVDKFPLIRHGAAFVVACGVVAGVTKVDDMFAAMITLLALCLVGMAAEALGPFPAQEPLAGRFVLGSCALVVVAGSVPLTFPDTTGGPEGTYVALADLLGGPAVTDAQAGAYGGYAWLALIGGLMFAFAFRMRCRVAVRRRAV